MTLLDFAKLIGTDTETAKRMIQNVCQEIVLSETRDFPEHLEKAVTEELLDCPERIKTELTHILKLPVELPHHGSSYGESKRFLLKCKKDKRIVMMDTCSLVQTHAGKLLDLFEEVFSPEWSLLVPYVVYLELQKLAASGEPAAEDARKCIARLKTMSQKQVVKFPYNKEQDLAKENKVFADPVFDMRMRELRKNGVNGLLITQDKNLTMDILAINHQRSVYSRATIQVCKVDVHTGWLVSSE